MCKNYTKTWIGWIGCALALCTTKTWEVCEALGGLGV